MRVEQGQQAFGVSDFRSLYHQWWLSQKLQEFHMQLIERYAPRDPREELRKELKSQIEKESK